MTNAGTLTYIDALNCFSACLDKLNAERTQVSASEVALFYAVASVWNRLGRKSEWTAISHKELSRLCGMSQTTIDRTRTKLVSKGLLACIPSEGRKPAMYCITVVKAAAEQLKAIRTEIVKLTAQPIQNECNHREREKRKTTTVVQRKAEPKQPMTPPSTKEVEEFCEQQHIKIDARKFVAFYAQRAWKIGKRAMKSWQDAVLYWAATEYPWKKEQTGRKQKLSRPGMGAQAHYQQTQLSDEDFAYIMGDVLAAPIAEVAAL